MKFRNIKWIATIFSACVLTACGDDLAELNVDPNAAVTGSAPEVFTAAIGYYGVALDAYLNERDAVLAQYWAGGPGVALINDERYFFTPSTFNTDWSLSYGQTLGNLKFVMTNGNEALASVANITSVHVYQNLVDHYGDVPYTTALSGQADQGGVLTPTYDNAKDIYTDLVARLNASIEVLQNTDEEIGDADIIYNGDVEKWIRFANSLKLRLLVRMSNTDTSVEPAIEELIASGMFITTVDQMPVIPFSAGNSNWNPQYASAEGGIGQFYTASQTSIDALEERNDPRLGAIYNPAAATGAFVGVIQGGITDLNPTPPKAAFSYPSKVAYAADNDVILMSNWEVYFLRAEADVRFNTADDEVEMFTNAVEAHFVYVGLTDDQATAYINEDVQYNAATSLSEKLGIIGVQKWISFNGLQETEGWIESRRFDSAEIGSGFIFTDPSNGIFVQPKYSVLGTGKFPTLYLYPQTEISFNEQNVPKGRAVTDKVFWDN